MNVATWEETGIRFPARYGDHFDTLCPECSHTRSAKNEKCLYVDLVENYWYCHHCKWTGHVGTASQDWRERLPKPKPMPKPSALPQDGELAPWVIDFFAGRGIGTEVLKRNGVRAGTIHEGRTDVIVIPFRRDGEIITAKFRYRHLVEGKKKHEMEAGTEKIPFGIDDCAGASEIVIVEGEPDKFAIEQATGRRAVLSPPSGAKINDEQLAAMVEACGNARVILAGDMDDIGEAMQEKLASRLGYHRCARVRWPCKDANDTLIDYGADVVAAFLNDAKPYPIEGIVTVDDISPDIDRLYDEGMPGGASTGWTKLDRFYTVREGQLTIVTGAPGSGKSVWTDALLVNLATLGWTAGVCSPEQLPLARHAAHLIACYQGQPFGVGPSPRMSRADMLAAKAWLATWCTFVMPEENTIDAVLERGVMLKARTGINAFVIDPWTELDHTRPNGMTETEFIHASLTKIRQFARNYACHVWVIAHPTKLRKDDDGGYPVATPYDISGSAGWFNKADNCLSVWRNKNDETQPVEIHVQKIRFHEIGGLGMVRFHHDRLTGRYREV